MAIQLFLKGTKEEKKSKGAELPLFFRYSYEGKDCLISAKKKISLLHWDEEKERPKSSYPGGAVNLGRYLGKVKGQIEKAITDIQNDERDPMPAEVKKKYEENTGLKKRDRSTVLGAWETRLSVTGKRSTRSIRNERASFETLKAYFEKHKLTGITFKSLDKDTISGYEKFLAQYTLTVTEETSEGAQKVKKSFKENTKAKKLKHLKALLRENNHDLTRIIKFKERPGDKIFLTKSELMAFQAYDLSKNPRLDRVRDLFVLQCFTGLRVSDLKRLNKAHVTADALNIRAQKNKEFIKLPLTPEIKRIFEKYDYELPVISDQNYNEYLKEVAAKAIPKSKVEITEYRGGQTIHKNLYKHEVLTSHHAIKTAATLWAQAGMPITSIAMLLGKTVATLLKNYLGRDEEQAQKDFVKYFPTLMKVS